MSRPHTRAARRAARTAQLGQPCRYGHHSACDAPSCSCTCHGDELPRHRARALDVDEPPLLALAGVELLAAPM